MRKESKYPDLTEDEVANLCAKSKEGQMKKRKRYTKPEIRRVPLRPQESVLGFCKNSNTQGPRIGTCTRPGNCMTEGS